jgi:hypothetical protein
MASLSSSASAHACRLARNGPRGSSSSLTDPMIFSLLSATEGAAGGVLRVSLAALAIAPSADHTNPTAQALTNSAWTSDCAGGQAPG